MKKADQAFSALSQVFTLDLQHQLNLKAFDENKQKSCKTNADMIYAELSGDFPLGDSRQPTYKSLRPFDLVS